MSATDSVLRYASEEVSEDLREKGRGSHADRDNSFLISFSAPAYMCYSEIALSTQCSDRDFPFQPDSYFVSGEGSLCWSLRCSLLFSHFLNGFPTTRVYPRMSNKGRSIQLLDLVSERECFDDFVVGRASSRVRVVG